MRLTFKISETNGLRRHLLALCLIMLAPAASASATSTWYANPNNATNCPCTAPSPNGNGACGTQGNPYSCISDGVNKASSGDTVTAVSGTYNECLYIRGSGKNNITVQSQVSRGAIIQRNYQHPVCQQIDPDSGKQDTVWIADTSGVLFKGFKVTGASANGIFVFGTGSGNEINDVEAYGNAGGIFSYTGGDTIRNCSLHNNQGNGILLSGAPNTLVFYTTATFNGGAGLALYPGADATNIATLTSSNNGSFGIYMASNGNSLQTITLNDNKAEGLYVLGSNNLAQSGEIARNMRGILFTCSQQPCTSTPAGNHFSALDIHHNTPYDGIKLDGGMSNWIDNSHIHHNGGNGILEGHASFSFFQWNEIDGNGFLALPNPGYGHGMYLGGQSSTAAGNKVHDNSGYGIHLWAAPWGTAQNHYIVEHNDVYRNSGGIVLGGSNFSPPVLRELPQYTEIRYNMIHHNRWMGFYYLLTTCIGQNNTGNSFHHNTVANNDALGGSQVWISHAWDNQFIFKNNIVVGKSGDYLLHTSISNMRADGADGNLYYRPTDPNGDPNMFYWNTQSFATLSPIQSPGAPQWTTPICGPNDDPNTCCQPNQDPNTCGFYCPYVDPNGAATPLELHSSFSSGVGFLDSSMNQWQDDVYGAPYNSNLHLAPGSAGITGGVCCAETTGGTDFDSETPPTCYPSDCASPGTGVGADYFRDTDQDGIADRYDCAPNNAADQSICDHDLYTSAEEAVCGFPAAYDTFVYPSAPEICDGRNNDCNPNDPPTAETDADHDGYFDGGSSCAIAVRDCDPSDPTVHPNAGELCDGRDNDCNGVVDDLGSTTCGVGACQVTVQNCAAGARQICTPGNPVTEGLGSLGTCFDGIDNDCDGVTDNDCGTNSDPSSGQLVVTGSIASGSLADISATSSDDTYEKFDEALVGSSRQLTVVWTFNNPSGGLLYDLMVEGYRAYGNDSFQFSRATRSSGPCTASESWSASPILTLSKPQDDDKVITASTDVTGPVTCIRVKDSIPLGDSTPDRLALDRLFLFPTPVADGEIGPSPGIKQSGTYASTRTSDDVNEVFLEQMVGPPNQLIHTWTFHDVPAGSSHQLNLEGHRSSTGADNFQFYYSTDNVTYNIITGAEIKKITEAQGGGYYTFGNTSLSGTVYIRMKDENPSNSLPTTVYVDRLAIKTVP